MKYQHFVLSILSSVIACSSYAQPNVTLINSSQRLNLPEKSTHSLQITNTQKKRLKNIKQTQLNALLNLREKLTTTIRNQKLQTLLLSDLDNSIAKTQKLVAMGDATPEINFLNLQLSDALNMLDAMKSAAKNTLFILQKMNDLAVQAANASNSSDDLRNLDFTFQAYKNVIAYFQSVDLFNGEKTVSGGDVNIRIGNNEDDLTTLKINIPAFDLTTLNIQDSSIDTLSNACRAVGQINLATDEITTTLAALSTQRIEDAETMLASFPSVYYQDLYIYLTMQNLILQAMNGTWSSADLSDMDLYFNALKDMLKKNQTYVSLAGPKMLGGGGIHIQIGNQKTDATTLDIDLPVTDVKALDMDQLNVLSQYNASLALDSLLKDLHDFAYSTDKSKPVN